MTGRAHRGMTLLEIMIVLAIVGLSAFLVRTGFRALTKADLVEDSMSLAAMMKRASSLAVEHGQLHRVLIDVDQGVYVVEACQGSAELKRNEAVRPDAEAKDRAIARGKDRLLGVPTDAFGAGDPEEAAKRVMALAGAHVADRLCGPVQDAVSGTTFMAEHAGESVKNPWLRTLTAKKGIKFKEIWVQHRDDSVIKGQVAVYFFPNGTSEKAVIELTDGGDIFTVLDYGLTGRIELHDTPLKDVNDHMMRNAMGEKDSVKHEDQR